jgi:iron complex outermembrane receptor protein
MKKPIGLIGCWVVLCFVCVDVRAQKPQQQLAQKADLTAMNIEDLMNVEVTSATKKSEALSDAPAAIFVITGEEIRRGGFSSVPDALRMVPGMHVSQQNAHVWQVSARGFSGFLNNKMLVLIDGRLVYTPTFGGVWWDVQDPPLDDIGRIEVILGPGGTLWGANAVNGVINIITKGSAKTPGVLFSTSAGMNEGYAAGVRFGGTVGTNFAYRIYGTSNDWLPSVDAMGTELNDTWSISQGGMRSDWQASQKDAITFDGEGYSGRIRDTAPVFSPTAPPVQVNTNYVVKGGHLLGQWKHTFNDRSATDVLGYCDWTGRSDTRFAGESRNTCDFEIQHNYSFSSRHSLTWGGSVMTTGETKPDTFGSSFVPPSRADDSYSAFFQYDVMVVPEKWRVIAGSKFDQNEYTGFEYQPQIRAVWTPAKSHTVWVAVSRAVRTPSRFNSDLRQIVSLISAMPPTFLLLSGDPTLGSEVLHAYELGYRYKWKQKFSLDAAAYYNGYIRLLGTGSPGAPIVNPNPFYVGVPLLFASVGGGQTHGLELNLVSAPVHRWNLAMGIAELRGNSVPGANVPAAAADPRHQVNVHSMLDLTSRLNLDAAYYYNDAISHALPPVNRVDVGVSTKPIRGFAFSVWGRNLQRDKHQEVIAQTLLGGEIRRSVVFKLIWESSSDHGSGKP